jgi:murein DD-endopeptidase MepM/ murein hydrolase activator NlpD
MTLRFGLHAPTAGATGDFLAAAAALHARLFVWTTSEHARDAEPLPDAFHIVRVPTPLVGEDAGAWCGRVAQFVDEWSGADVPPGSLVFQLGNEPEIATGPDGDVPVAWAVGPWKESFPWYAATFRARWPSNGTLSAPFASQNTRFLDAMYTAACHGVAVHAYWSAGNPGWRWGEDGGQTWRTAVPFGMPIYVTEVNSNPTSVDEMVAWLGEVDSALVMGAAWFIADSPQSFPQYNVTASDAAELAARWHPVPTPVNPPDPPTPEPPAPPYTRDYDPRGYRPLDPRWRDFIALFNSVEVIAICAAVDAAARRIDYDANAMMAQACVETAVFTSLRWRSAHAAAGIGIYGDGTPDIIWGDPPHGTVEAGIDAMADLLTCYFRNDEEPYGMLLPHGFGGFALHDSRLAQMDGVWARDTGYSAAIVRYMNDVLAGDAPAPPPTPAPQPVPPAKQRFPMVLPVADKVIQGSDGTYSHGGATPGFYAIDFACSTGTPVRAIADGTVGTTYWTDSNPISLRTGHSIWVDHITGYSTFSCHLQEFLVATGDTVRQGQVIGYSGDPASQPNNGYGDGPHLHWEIWDTARHVRVRMEDLLAAGQIGPYEAAAVIRWRAANVGEGYDTNEQRRQWFGTNAPTKTAQKKHPYNPTFGIPQAYGRLMNGTFGSDPGDMQDLRGISICLGPATSGEENDPGTPGRVVQYFACGKIAAYRQPTGAAVAWKFNVS